VYVFRDSSTYCQFMHHISLTRKCIIVFSHLYDIHIAFFCAYWACHFFLQYLLYTSYKLLAKMNCNHEKNGYLAFTWGFIYLIPAGFVFDRVYTLLGNINETEYVCLKWETIWATLNHSWIIFILSLSPLPFKFCQMLFLSG